MERSTNEVGAYGNGEAIEKIKQEINGVKMDRLQFQIDFKEELKELMEIQKDSVTKELLDNFRKSLRDKFEQEGRKMSDHLQEMSKLQQMKIQNSVSEVRLQLNGLMNLVKQQIKSNQMNASLQLRERV